MLFDLTADPRETTNLGARDPATCTPFARQVAAWEAENRVTAARLGLAPAPPARIDESLRRRLRALGYEEP